MIVATWSGPRNLSTALMYAFAQRADFEVRDEPFYAAFLAATGRDHPMREAVLESQPVDPARVAADCIAPTDGRHRYLKLMAHHMVPGVDAGVMAECRNVFLIRHPARVLASYAAKREDPTLEDIGAHRMSELFAQASARGPAPIVVDSADIRADPEGMLRALCAALGLPFDPAMLAWPAGGNPADGVWAPHWYGAIHRSTGFAGPEGPLPDLPAPLARLAAAARPSYEALARRRLLSAGNTPLQRLPR
jgi:hypothetical protein